MGLAVRPGPRGVSGGLKEMQWGREESVGVNSVTAGFKLAFVRQCPLGSGIEARLGINEPNEMGVVTKADAPAGSEGELGIRAGHPFDRASLGFHCRSWCGIDALLVGRLRPEIGIDSSGCCLPDPPLRLWERIVVVKL